MLSRFIFILSFFFIVFGDEAYNTGKNKNLSHIEDGLNNIDANENVLNLIYFQNKNTSENHSNNEHILQISDKMHDDQDFVKEHEIISSNNKIDSHKPLKSRRIHFKEYLTAYIVSI